MMTALLLALAVWLVLRAFEGRSHTGPAGPCRICRMATYWDGQHFMHADGQRRRPYDPPIYLDPLDESAGEMLHPAIPVDA